MQLRVVLPCPANGEHLCGFQNTKFSIQTVGCNEYNAAHLVESGLGYAITLDKLIDTRNTGDLCFRPLTPRLESRLNIV